MKHGINSPRPLDEGMGVAVARRTYLRKFTLDGKPFTKKDHQSGIPFKWETWGEVAARVSEGNCSLSKHVGSSERTRLQEHIANASILMSGRHLQHGDMTQKTRTMECFTNCSTASTSFMKFYLLLNGSGVGRCYDDKLMLVDWSRMPHIRCCLDSKHPDYDYRVHESLEQAMHKYGNSNVIQYRVEDSREGWAKVVEMLESYTYEGEHENSMILIDFSGVRAKGELIGGMQLRPSSGPVPTMNALNQLATLKGCRRPTWWQNMYVDHYLAESVLVGGARRSARIAVKNWRDPGIIDFINIKYTKNKSVPLWSANNSVGVDDDFWKDANKHGTWANKVFEAVCNASYNHGTGEPAFVNLHKLNAVDAGRVCARDIGSKAYKSNRGSLLLHKMDEVVQSMKYFMIPNPCGEITLYMLGGYCVIGDVVPFHCETLEEFYEAVRLTVRALIRTNLMDSMYHNEVTRTNRIGVGLTGIHEFAWKFFKLTFSDLVNVRKSKKFWDCLESAQHEAIDEAKKYSKELGVKEPHTVLTIKPSGSISKLFGLTEGAHLPSMRAFIRWVQFRSDDPLVKKYIDMGYKTIVLQKYEGTTVVGFPTRPVIASIGLPEITIAPEASSKDQYRWIELLEKYWLGESHGNQVSYTLKYDKSKLSYDEFKKQMLHFQPRIKCCSVMPTTDLGNDTEYEYLPEESCTLEAYDAYVSALKGKLEEHVDEVHLACSGGACPVEIKGRDGVDESRSGG